MIAASHSMLPGQNPRVFWKHVVGLVLMEMRRKGWTGAKILDAEWKGGTLSIRVGPGHGALTPEALADFLRAKRGGQGRRRA